MNNTDINLYNLKVHFPSMTGLVKAVDDVSLTLHSSQITGIIGESGSGKSVLVQAILRMIRDKAVLSGQILYGDKDINQLSTKEMRDFRNTQLSLLPQNPDTSLNPIMKVGKQIGEAIDRTSPKKASKQKVLQAIEQLGFDEPKDIYHRYPFQLSGGMRERILIALSLIRDPEWLIADEPTKGLDYKLKQAVAEELRKICQQRKGGVLLVTHDIELAHSLCDRVLVMYGGNIIEDGPAHKVLESAKHPYTKALIESLPQRGFHRMKGNPIAISDLPTGCPFHPRCPMAQAQCRYIKPTLKALEEDHYVRCYYQA